MIGGGAHASPWISGVLAGVLGLARALGATREATRRSHVGALGAILPGRSRRAIAMAARQLEANRFTRELLRRVGAQLGWAAVAPLVEVRGELPAAGGRGTLVVSWHWGIGVGVVLGLASRGLTGAVLRYRPGPEVPRFTSIYTGDSIAQRAQAFQRALDHLRRGEVVVVFYDLSPADGPRPEAVVPLWSRLVHLPRGPALLARLSGASTHIAHARWRGGARPIELVLSEAMAPPEQPADDEAWTRTLGAHFERRIIEAPGELWPESLRAIASAAEPVIPGGRDRTEPHRPR